MCAAFWWAKSVLCIARDIKSYWIYMQEVCIDFMFHSAYWRLYVCILKSFILTIWAWYWSCCFHFALHWLLFRIVFVPKSTKKKNEPEARKHCAHLLTCANSRQSYYVCAVNGKCLFSFGQINMDFICFWDLLLFYSVEILFVNVKHFGMSNGCSGKMQSNRGKKYFVSVFFVLFLWS